VPAFQRIEAPPDWWLWKIGMIYPVQSTLSAPRVGAERKCIFNSGAAFDEKITVWQPAHRLAFDVVRQPADPEIVGHFQLQRGQFVLHDNGDGTTTVVGTSWYQLRIEPRLYFDWWARAAVAQVHRRVFEHIRILAENDTQK